MEVIRNVVHAKLNCIKKPFIVKAVPIRKARTVFCRRFVFKDCLGICAMCGKQVLDVSQYRQSTD